MNTEIIRITNTSADEEALERAGRIIKDGGLVVFPTETVYGLGGDATISTVAQKIYAAKGRPSDNPLIVHIEHPEDAEQYAFTDERYYKLAKAFMPGPLTIIMPKKDIIPKEVTGGLDTVAVRCPSHPVASRLISHSKTAIAAPSANLSGKPSPTRASHVIDDLMGQVDMIIDGGSCEIGLESTIVKLDEGAVILLRPGAITYDALCCVCDNVKISHAVSEQLAANEQPLSPGMKYKHYAPSAPFVLLEGNKEKLLEFLLSEQKSKTCCILAYTEDIPFLMKSEYVIDIGNEQDYITQARNLFAALRKADETPAEIIYAHVPNKSGMGLALYNRMIRAAAHTIKTLI